MEKTTCLLLLLLVSSLAQPFDGTWTKIVPSGDVPVGRGSPVKIEMGGPNVYIFGGLVESGSGPTAVNTWFNDLYRYNLLTHSWTQLHPQGTLPAARAFSTGWKVNSKSFMICGGGAYTATFSQVNLYNDFWRYDILTNTWTQVFPSGDALPSGGLLGLGSAQVSANIVYIWGGIQISGGFTDAIQVIYKYDIAANVLTQLNPAGTEFPFGHHPVVFPTGAGFRITFRDLLGPDPDFLINWEYNAANNAWVQLNSANQPLTRAYYDGDLIANLHIGYGGDFPDGNIESEETLNETLAYSIPRDAWKVLNTNGNPPSLKRHRVTRLGNALFMLLGYTVDETTNFERVFLTDTWKFVPNIGSINRWFNRNH